MAEFFWSIVYVSNGLLLGIEQAPVDAGRGGGAWTATTHVGRRVSAQRRHHGRHYADSGGEEVRSSISSTPCFSLPQLSALHRAFHRKNGTFLSASLYVSKRGAY